MPYIDPMRRNSIADYTDDPMSAGELNYALTMRCVDYFRVRGVSYQTFNDIIGALEACKMEFYRRMVSPYEDHKIDENGDVYL